MNWIRKYVYGKKYSKNTKGNNPTDNPYVFEQEKGLFGSYVKINEDIWQIYDVKEDSVNLVLNNYHQENYKI